MAGREDLHRRQRAAIRELLPIMTVEGRNFILVQRLSRPKSLVFLPAFLIIQFILFLIQAIMRSEDLELIGWPEVMKWYDKYVIALTNKGLVVARLVNFPKFASRLGRIERVEAKNFINLEFDGDAESGRLVLSSESGIYEFKVRSAGWIRRSKQLVSIVGHS
jgi:hypothetical protein